MIRRRFGGIYPQDMIPKTLSKGSVIIVNQGTSDQRGSPCVVLHYIHDSVVEYFNSVRKKNKMCWTQFINI